MYLLASVSAVSAREMRVDSSDDLSFASSPNSIARDKLRSRSALAWSGRVMACEWFV